MRYFVIKQDEQITDIPYPKDFFEHIDIRNVNAERGDLIPHRILIQLRPSKFTVFPELLCAPVLLVSKDAQDVIKLYDESIEYRQIIYLDKENGLAQLYFMPLLVTIDCLSPRSEYIKASRTAFSEIVLRGEKIRDESIFMVKNQTQRVVTVRLDLTENLLTQGCGGFTLEEAEVETEENG